MKTAYAYRTCLHTLLSLKHTCAVSPIYASGQRFAAEQILHIVVLLETDCLLGILNSLLLATIMICSGDSGLVIMCAVQGHK